MKKFFLWALLLINAPNFAQVPLSVGSIEDDWAADVDRDIDQNIYAAYNINGTTVFGGRSYTPRGRQDMAFVKYSPLGAQEWLIALGSTENDQINAIEVDISGNVYIGGYISARTDLDPSTAIREITTAGKKDAFIAKYDKNGIFQWGYSWGANEDDEVFDIETDARGGVYVAGRFQGSVDFNPSAGVFRVQSRGGNDWFLLKFKDDGTFLWANVVGGTANDWEEGMAASIAAESVGNCYLYATFRGTVNFNPRGNNISLNNPDSLNTFLAKYTTDGFLSWVNRFTSPQKTFVSAGAIGLDYLGDIVATGSFSQTIDADASNRELRLNSRGKQDIFMIKTDANGRVRWAISGGGFEDDAGLQIRSSLQGNLVLIGWFEGNAEFRSGANVVSFSANPNTRNTFIANFDNFGGVRWAKTWGNNPQRQSTLPKALCVDGQENPIFIGHFYDNLLVSPERNLISKGKSDIFLIKLDKNGQPYATRICEGKPAVGEILGDSAVCAGQIARLRLFRPTEAIGIEIQWQISTDRRNFRNIGTASNASEITTNALFQESFVRAIITCKESKIADTSKVLRILVSDLEVDIGQNREIKVGEQILLGGNPVAKKGIGRYRYSWTPRSVLVNPNTANPLFRPLLEGEYTFTLSVSDSICTALQTVKILVSPIVALESATKIGLQVFPNPAKNILEMRYYLPQNTWTKIEIINLQGEVLESHYVESKIGFNQVQFLVEKFPKGIYFYKMSNDLGIWANKFVVE